MRNGSLFIMLSSCRSQWFLSLSFLQSTDTATSSMTSRRDRKPAPCANYPHCPCDSFDGHEGVHCCRQCEKGNPCSHACHVFEERPSSPNPPATDATPRRNAQEQVARNTTALMPARPAEVHKYSDQLNASGQQMAAACARRSCKCDSWNGSVGEYCCYTCRQGTPCTQRYHEYKGTPTAALGQAAGRRSHSTAVTTGQHHGRSHYTTTGVTTTTSWAPCY